MDFNATIDIIIKDLKEIRDIVDDLKNYPDVPALQIELAKSKCRSAEEIISLLKTYRPAESRSGKIEETLKEIEADADKLIDISADESENAETPASEGSSLKEEIRPEKGIVREIAGEQGREPVIEHSRFTETGSSLVEQYGAKKRGEAIASNIKAVTNLSDVIGFNDKFLFIREIFSGNSSAYDEALQKLNNSASLSEAIELIKTYAGESTDKAATARLIEIVKLKLPSNG